MCLAIPALIVERLEGEEGLIDLGGVRKRVSLSLVPEAEVGDYVIVHVGYAISRLDPEEAARTLALFAETGVDLAGGEAAEAATA
jgi:hydrogenase expression/formation protein HypC